MSDDALPDDPYSNLVDLVDMLRTVPDVSYFDVEQRVRFPGWQLILQRMFQNTHYFRGVTSTYGPVLTEEARARLLDWFEPFAVLLDLSRTPQERADMLRVTGIDVMAFCRTHHADGSPIIREAAQSVLAAAQFQTTLLRGAERTPEAAEQLLRAAAAANTPQDELLHPDSVPSDFPSQPFRANLWERLAAKAWFSKRVPAVNTQTNITREREIPDQ